MCLPVPHSPSSASQTASSTTSSTPATARLQGADLLTPTSFHRTFRTKLGFPSYYGNNMDAWIDVMSSGDTELITGQDRRITMIIEDPGEEFRGCQMKTELCECVEFINVERAGYEMLKVVFED